MYSVFFKSTNGNDRLDKMRYDDYDKAVRWAKHFIHINPSDWAYAVILGPGVQDITIIKHPQGE